VADESQSSRHRGARAIPRPTGATAAAPLVGPAGDGRGQYGAAFRQQLAARPAGRRRCRNKLGGNTSRMNCGLVGELAATGPIRWNGPRGNMNQERCDPGEARWMPGAAYVHAGRRMRWGRRWDEVGLAGCA